ncbi:type II toxin-antitoxin system VapC family toxin [Micromonospora sp. H33]|uniref:type II toxin-antitoxin system VapC family toxin n=1 Tax=Micromonospora sp. H33 TaxID=3452215 RepID=UPI003F896E8A
MPEAFDAAYWEERYRAHGGSGVRPPHPHPRAREAVDALSSLVVDNVDIAPLLQRMWQLRANVSAYDGAYVAAAELLSCPLVTGDVRLTKTGGVRCEVRLVTPR